MDQRTCLVVEDDPSLRASLTLLLEEGGLSVVAMASADDALAFLAEQSDHVAAVLTDVMMPGATDGLQLAGVISRQWPKMAVLLTSGRVRPMNELPRQVRFIPKPCRSDELVAAMQQASLAA